MIYKRKTLQLLRLCVCGVFFLMTSSAYAACTGERAKQLKKSGNTVASISKTCKMSKEEVKELLDEVSEDGKDESSENKLPIGAPVGDCGCWGFASAHHRQPHQMCKSGFAKPSFCPAICPLGGYAWRGVCT